MTLLKPSSITNQSGVYGFKGSLPSSAQNYIDNSFPNILNKTGDNITGTIGFSGSGGLNSLVLPNINVIPAALANYTVVATDFIIFVPTTSTSIVVHLPTPTLGRVLVVKDSSNNASANNIVLSPGSNKVDGGSSATMNTNSAVAILLSDGSNWFSISRFGF